MGKLKPPLKGEAATKFYREGGIKQYFSNNIPKMKAGRRKKRTFSNRKKNKDVSPPPTSLKSPPEQSAGTASKAQDNTAAAERTPQDSANDDNEPVPPLSPQVLEDSDDDKSVSPLSTPAKPKATRINWTVGEHRLRMEQAVKDWLEQADSVRDGNGEIISNYAKYANKMGIPSGTFFHYVHPDPDKRRTLDQANRGKPRLLTDSDVKLAGAVLARADRGNDGYSRKEAADLIQDLNPDINRLAARRQLSNIVLPKNHEAGVLKEAAVKAQPTTSDRTNINVAQQYRWHRLVDQEYDYLRATNTGLCGRSGKTFGEVIEHFIWGLDEMCLMSDHHGNLHVIACAEKKKHEKLLQDTRVSITMVRIGSVGGTTGPTIFLLKGAKQNRRKEFSDEYLVRHGCAPGSTIVMTESAYMTDVAWLEASKAIVKGYRNMPYVKENKQWSVLELLDGFKSHENVLAAHRLRAEYNIRSIKEESNTSHANQGYDQETARQDKKHAAESLYDQRKVKKMNTGKTRIDQYDLVLTGIRIVTKCSEEVWVCSFRRVNLDPRTRISFENWCQKIKQFLTAGEQFKEELVDLSPQETFNLLPATWHGMEPAERKVVMTILESHDFQYTAASLQQLHTECMAPYVQMNDVRVCVLIARQHPETLDMLPKKTDEVTGIAAVEEAKAAAAKQSDGMDDFQLVPKNAEGKPKFLRETLLEHMIKRRNAKFLKEVRRGPTPGLDVHLYSDSLEMIQPTAEDMRRARILEDHCGERAKRKCAKRKLNSIGLVVGQSTVVNSAENMARMQEELNFADACAEIERLEDANKAAEKKKKTQDLKHCAPAAARKLNKDKVNIGKLTVVELESLLHIVYSITVPGAKSKLRKPDYVKALERAMTENIGKFEAFLNYLPADDPTD